MISFNFFKKMGGAYHPILIYGKVVNKPFYEHTCIKKNFTTLIKHNLDYIKYGHFLNTMKKVMEEN